MIIYTKCARCGREMRENRKEGFTGIRVGMIEGQHPTWDLWESRLAEGSYPLCIDCLDNLKVWLGKDQYHG